MKPNQLFASALASLRLLPSARTRRPNALSLLSFALVTATPVSAAPSGQSLFQAVRANDLEAARALLESGTPVDVRSENGDTPLLAAGLSAGPEVVALLLEYKADPNAVNEAGATPLIRAAGRPGLVEPLLQAGAHANASSKLGNTPLMVAARRHGSIETLRRLVEAGADPSAANQFGATPLMAAAAAGDREAVAYLLDQGADIDATPEMNPTGFVFGGGRSALMWAAFRGDEALLRFLLERGADVNRASFIGTALTQAAWAGHQSLARILIESGAETDARDPVGNYTPLHWAASSEKREAELAKLLIENGADPAATGGEPVDGFLGMLQTPLGLAGKRGETPIVRVLHEAGAPDTAKPEEKEEPSTRSFDESSIDESAVAASIARAIPPLQETAAISRASFMRHASKQNCVSCHQQYLPMGAVGMARELGLPIDTEAAREQIILALEHPTVPPDFDAQVVFHPEPAIEMGYHLFGLHAEKQPADHLTDSFVHHLCSIQEEDGRWLWNMPRPPLQSSSVAATALAVFSLRAYPIPGRQDEIDARVNRASAWLRQAQVETNEEATYQILGLVWAGADQETLKPLAVRLASAQRPDGGWAQLAGLSSDPYATGLTLYSLAKTGSFTLQDPTVRHAVRFLLERQAPDGTWHVRRRAFPFQPPMESGFPYGADSWISAAGSSWAAMGLAALLDPAHPPVPDPVLLSAKSPVPSPGPLLTAEGPSDAPHDFARDIQPVLERSCVACHSGAKPKGGFRLENRASLLAGGNRGEPAVVPGDPGASAVLACVTDAIDDLEMPPLGKRDKYPALSSNEVTSLKAWIAAGAVWPDGVELAPR